MSELISPIAAYSCDGFEDGKLIGWTYLWAPVFPITAESQTWVREGFMGGFEHWSAECSYSYYQGDSIFRLLDDEDRKIRSAYKQEGLGP